MSCELLDVLNAVSARTDLNFPAMSCSRCRRKWPDSDYTTEFDRALLMMELAACVEPQIQEMAHASISFHQAGDMRPAARMA